MLKVLSGEKIYTSSGETSLRFFAYKSCLFIVSGGNVSFDGNTLGHIGYGDHVFVKILTQNGIYCICKLAVTRRIDTDILIANEYKSDLGM